MVLEVASREKTKEEDSTFEEEIEDFDDLGRNVDLYILIKWLTKINVIE